MCSEQDGVDVGQKSCKLVKAFRRQEQSNVVVSFFKRRPSRGNCKRQVYRQRGATGVNGITPNTFLLCHHTVVWGILSLLCAAFVCLFVWLRISQRRKKIAA